MYTYAIQLILLKKNMYFPNRFLFKIELCRLWVTLKMGTFLKRFIGFFLFIFYTTLDQKLRKFVCLLQSVTDWQTLFGLWFLMFQTSENPAVITARCFNIWHSRKCHTMRKFKGSLDEAALLNNMLSSNSYFRLPRRKYSTDILWPKYRNQRTPAY